MLEFVKSCPTTRSLAAYDKFDSVESYRFMQIFRHRIDDTITGSESLPEEMLTSKKDKVSLSDDVYELLVQYYDVAYDFKFVTIVETVSRSTLDNFIVILSKINQFGHIRIRIKIFSSTIAP